MIPKMSLSGMDGFNAAISRTPSRPSAIGYAPFIPAPLTEMSVVYTLLLNTATMLNRIGPEYPVLTLDKRSMLLPRTLNGAIIIYSYKARWISQS